MTTEKDFQAAVIDYAELNKWIVFHVHDSRRQVRDRRTGDDLLVGDWQARGYPDLTLVRPPRVVFAELKIQPPTSKKGRLTAPQQEWADALGQCDGVAHYVWRPGDWPQIEEVLR